MEPLDTDTEYATYQPRPATPGSRVNLLFIFPAIGVIIVLIFIAAAIFQFDLVHRPRSLAAHPTAHGPATRRTLPGAGQSD